MDHIILSPESLGEALRAERKKRGLTQGEVARPIGVDQGTLSQIENGSPGTKLDTILHLLAALELEMVLRPVEKTQKKQNQDLW